MTDPLDSRLDDLAREQGEIRILLAELLAELRADRIRRPRKRGPRRVDPATVDSARLADARRRLGGAR